MTRRYDILKGDSTTASGTVEGGNSQDRHANRAQAYAGDSIWCPACKAMGKVVCTGPRYPTTGPDGREAALSNDVCLCGCQPSPRLVPSQHTSFIDV